MLNNGSNISATIICEKEVGKPTQACLILTTLVSIVDDSRKACGMRIVSIFEQSLLQII